MTTIQVRETGTGTILPTEEGWYEEAPIEANRGSQAFFKVADEDGSLQAVITPGVICEVYEDGTRKFVGVVERRKRTRGVDGYYLEATLRDYAYHLLRASPCDPYTYSETGAPDTDRDAVKVNPWEWRIFRSPFGNVLDADGNPVPVDGVVLDDAFRGLAGSRFIFTARFEDDRLFRASDLTGTPGAQMRVLSDKYDTQDVPSLQRTRDTASMTGPASYAVASAFLRTVPLESGDPNVTPMGNITDLSIVLVGKEDSGMNAPVLKATRNARAGSPTYESVALTRVPNYNGSGLTAWVATNFLFSAAAGHSLGLQLQIGGASASETTRLYWMRLACNLVSLDTGLNSASAGSYTDPNGGTLDKVWIDEDFEGLNRADAMERLRTTTVTDPAVNRNPCWDIYTDANQVVYFKARRGTDLPYTYQLSDDSITVLAHEQFGEDLCYQVIAEGGGTGDTQFTITDRTDFFSGGLYSATRDPSGGSPLYGKLPKALVFRDQGTTSRSELRRRARAYMRDRLDPKDFFELRFVPFPASARPFSTGDSFIVADTTIGLNVRVQVTGLKVTWNATQGHGWEVTLGHTNAPPTTTMAGSNSKLSFAQKSAILAAANKTAGGPGIYSDANHYGRASFVVPDKVDVERCLLTIRTLPWQIYSRDSVSGLAGANSGQKPFVLELYEGSWVAPQASYTNFSNVFSVAPTASAELDYIDLALITWNQNSGLHETTPIFRIIRANGSFAGEVVASQDLSEPMRSVSVQNDSFAGTDDTVATLFRVVLRKATLHPILPTDTFQLQYQNTGGSWTQAASAFIGFIYQHTHAVPLSFGIWQYDGDTGTGNGTAFLGVVRFAIDPAVQANGDILVADFLAARHPQVVGDPGGVVSITLDITPYLKKDASGRVAPGEHQVVFQGIVTTGNAQGLATTAILTRLIAAEANG